MKDCAKRALTAGLRWCGIKDEAPMMRNTKSMKAFCEKYGLEFIEAGVICDYKTPAVVTFKSEVDWHTVFVSDLGPFSANKWTVHNIIIGWDKLAAKSREAR